MYQPQHPDEVSDLEWLLLEIERLEGCPETKRRALAVIKAQTGKVIRFTHRVLVRPERVQRARELIDAGNPTPQVRDQLVAVYGCSTRHAYELISEALQQRGQELAQRMRRAQIDLFRPDPDA